MEKKTIIRIADDVNFTPELSEALKTRFGQNSEFVRYSKKHNTKDSYQQRINSLNQAMLFILETIPLKKELLEKYELPLLQERIKKHLIYCLDKHKLADNLDYKAYKDILYRYKSMLLATLKDCWDCCPYDEQQVELLNKAEQYFLLPQERPNLITLSRVSSYSVNHYVLQCDYALPACTDETIAELQAIKASAKTLTPQWFKELPAYQQVFLHALNNDIQDFRDLKTALNSFITKWQSIEKNHVNDLAKNLEDIKKNNVSQLPAWFTNWSKAEQGLLQEMLNSSDGSIPFLLDKFNTTINSWTQAKSTSIIQSLAEIKKLPFWYLQMRDYTQLMLKACLNKVNKITDAVARVSSRLRDFPALPNAAEHQLLVIDEQGNVVIEVLPRYRSSHIAPRDEVKKPANIAALHTLRNLTKILDYAGEKTFIIIQTLISPIWLLSPKYLPDYTLNELRIKIVQQIRELNPTKQFFDVNHPYNFAKKIQYTEAKNPFCNGLLTAARDYLEPSIIEKQISNLRTEHEVLLLKLVRQSSKINPQVLAQLKTILNNVAVCYPNKPYQELVNLIGQAQQNLLNESDFTFIDLDALSASSSVDDIEPLSSFMQENKSMLQPEWLDFMSNYLFLKSNQHKKELDFFNRIVSLTSILREYEETLNSKLFTATFCDHSGREMFLSSLETLISLYICTEDNKPGFSYGSCVSGKDRKALEIIHTNAMILYNERYGYWPHFNETGNPRENFVNIVAELYLTWHAHVHAGQNAPGSEGIKTPAKYWSSDICDAIIKKSGQENILIIDDEIATLNEVKAIKKTKGYALEQTASAKYLMEAEQLSDTNQQRLINELSLILRDPNLFHRKIKLGMYELPDKITGTPPTGIFELNKILGRKNNEDNTNIIAQIYEKVAQRPDESTRTQNVKKLYHNINSLFHSEEPEAIFEEVLAKLKALRGISSPNATSYAFN